MGFIRIVQVSVRLIQGFLPSPLQKTHENHFLISSSFFVSSHLSGLKLSGSEKASLTLFIDHGCVETVVPAGMKYFPTLNPSAGTVRSRDDGAAPYSRRPGFAETKPEWGSGSAWDHGKGLYMVTCPLLRLRSGKEEPTGL